MNKSNLIVEKLPSNVQDFMAHELYLLVSHLFFHILQWRSRLLAPGRKHKISGDSIAKWEEAYALFILVTSYEAIMHRNIFFFLFLLYYSYPIHVKKMGLRNPSVLHANGISGETRHKRLQIEFKTSNFHFGPQSFWF